MKDPDVSGSPDVPKLPDALNRMVDVVLAYRPKPKSKGAKKRTRKKKALEKKEKEQPS